MIRNIQRRWFEVWGDEEAQNRILKYFLLLIITMSVAQMIVISILAFKKPLIISMAMDSLQTKVIQSQEPDSDALLREVSRCLQSYLRTRHNWDVGSIDENSKRTIQYIAPEYREKFLVMVQEQIRLAKEKQVAQRLFPDEPQIDMKTKIAVVHAERIIIVNGLRAAQGLRLELAFNLGERTMQNPEGIYITSEKLDTSN